MATYRTLQDLHIDFVACYTEYTKKLQEMVDFARANDFEDPFRSHPYTFETFLALQSRAEKLNDTFKMIQQTHQMLTGFFTL